jgi:ABC-2 type transport system permease protein
MIERTLAIARKELSQIWRDKRSLGLLAFVPTFTLLLFGFALNLDMRNIALAVVDEDHSSESRRFVASLVHDDSFVMTGELDSRRAINETIVRNRADVVVVIPAGFEERIKRREGATVQAIVDGSNASLGAAAAGYLDAYTQGFNARLQTTSLERNGMLRAAPIDYRPRIWFNPDLKSSRFLVPGLMGYVMIITTVISTALSIVREKERGTIEQILVSPATMAEFMVGKLIPYFVIACVLATGIVLAGWLLFDVPVRGSIPILAGALLLFIIGGLGMGMAISTVAKTQEAAFLLATVATALPTQLLSGFIFPIENMPAVLQAVTTIVPAKYLLVILRAVLLKGAPIASYWGSLVALAVFAFMTLSVAVLRLRSARG